MSHAWPCSGWGLPSRPGHPGRWCALTAPFHPYLCGEAPPSAVCSLWHFPAGHPDWPLASTLPCGAPTFLDTILEEPVPRPPGRLTVTPSVSRYRPAPVTSVACPWRDTLSVGWATVSRAMAAPGETPPGAPRRAQHRRAVRRRARVPSSEPSRGAASCGSGARSRASPTAPVTATSIWSIPTPHVSEIPRS